MNIAYNQLPDMDGLVNVMILRFLKILLKNASKAWNTPE